MSDRSLSTSSRRSLRGLATPARVYAVTRIALGLWIFVDPDGFGGKWFAAPQDPVLTGSVIRSVGGRDAAIGVGLLVSERPRPWLWLCAFCDVLDAGMVLLARSRFTQQEVVTSVGGALSYALIALAIAVFGTRTTR